MLSLQLTVLNLSPSQVLEKQCCMVCVCVGVCVCVCVCVRNREREKENKPQSRILKFLRVLFLMQQPS